MISLLVLLAWVLASFICAGLIALAGLRITRMQEAETDMSWPGHSFRIVDHDPNETVQDRARRAM